MPALGFYRQFPESNASYSIKSYLENVGSSDPSYLDRVMSAITPENYRHFCQASTDPRDENRMPFYWDDSGWWRLLYSGWPIEDLFFALEPQERIREILTTPLDPAVPGLESLQYRMLKHVCQTNKANAQDMAAIGKLMRASKTAPGYESLYERAVFAFIACWPSLLKKLEKNPVPEDLAAYAGEAFAEQCRLWQGSWDHDPRKLPVPLPGMDLKSLENAWSLGPDAWEELWSLYRAYVGDMKPVRDRTKPAKEHTGPQLFLAVRAEDDVIKFLLLTPVPKEPAWEARWSTMLKAANSLHGRTVTRLTDEIPMAQRSRQLSFLS